METEGMTRERLEAYRSNNDEIKELQESYRRWVPRKERKSW